MRVEIMVIAKSDYRVASAPRLDRLDLLALAPVRPHAVGLREAASWSVFYVAVTIGFVAVVLERRAEV